MSSEKKQPIKSSSLLGQWKKRKKSASVSDLVPRPKDAITVLSKGQKRLWLLQQLYPDNPFYQYAHFYEIQGDFDRVIFEKCFQQLIDRHEILRSNFIKKENNLLLVIKDRVSFSCQFYDFSDLLEKEKAAQEILEKESQEIFDLAQDPLLRVSVIQMSKENFQVILSIHHIIGDRWSLRLLNEELFALYKALKNNQTADLLPLKIQYPDFSHWQKNQKLNPKHLDYWVEQLSGELPLLNLPSDFKRPLKPSFRGAILSKKLSKNLSAQLHKLAKEEKVTMFVLLLSAFKVLLYRFTNQNDLIVGSPFSNRDKSELEKLIGFFNETLVLRTQIEGNWSFKELISKVNDTNLQAFEHKNIAFDELVRTLKIERHGSANPIFQSMFLYNSTLPFSIPDLDLKIKEKTIDLGVSKFDLTLFVNEEKENLTLSLEFALDLFKKETAERMLQHLEVILTSIVSNQNIPLSKLPLLDQSTSDKMLIEWNKTATDYPSYQSIHQLIEEQASLHPEKTAVVFQDHQINYQTLNRQANAIAAQLTAAGVQPNDTVGLYAHRSVELIVAILGILKAGAAYLPLDPTYPKERIDFMIQDAGTSLILCSENLKERLILKEAKILNIDASIKEEVSVKWKQPIIQQDQLAYTIYTSGSTGKPKGVPIRHKNLLHSTLARYTFYPSNPAAFLLLSSFSFDSSIVGIFWTLCSGGTLVLPPKRIEQDIAQLSNLIAKHKVSHTLMLPSLYAAVLNHAPIEQIHTLKNIIVAGEACPFSLIDNHYDRLPNTDLYNEYGPTEASVWCIAHKTLPNEKDFVPIGKAIPNTEIYILNSALEACPIGVPGEIYVGGFGVAAGYLNRPKLTAERFIDHPFKENKKVYKTGDLARFHADGRIEFLGRVDHQVKIRGFRVEPGEIQKKILTYETIEEALVTIHESQRENQPNQKRLIAYVSGVSDSKISELRRYLEHELPPYMVPSSIIGLQTFPRLPNGKINRKDLPDPTTDLNRSTVNFIAPTTPLELQLAKIWESVLNLESVGLNDNFFALGGDSILSIEVVSKARDQQIFIAPNQLFENQTIEALANSIQDPTSSKIEITPSAIENPVAYPLSSLQKAFLFNTKRAGADQGLLQLEFTISGEINFQQFQAAWQQSVDRHDAMRAYIEDNPKQETAQVIASKVSLDWRILDWQTQSKAAQEISLENLRLRDQKEEIDLKKPPVSRLYFIKLSARKHLLFWTCHHIFLDGWSCGIILKDALAFYDERSNQKTIKSNPLPNFLAYLDWRNKKDRSEEKQFWNTLLGDFKKPTLFKTSFVENAIFKDEYLKLTTDESADLTLFCKQNQISISTLFQGLWALLLARLFDQADIVYGLTVSGRFGNFPEIESISGLFMNVVPNRIRLNQETSLNDWLKKIQVDQGQKNKFETTPLEVIKASIDWPNQLELFDTLFVFGNFLKNGLSIGELKVEHFQGGFTSSYPLTIRVNPLSQIALDWRYDTAKISPTEIQWIKTNFYQLIKNIGTNQKILSVGDAAEIIDRNDHLFKNIITSVEQENDRTDHSPTPPRDKTEADLCTIWEQLFNQKNIGVLDNFFDLGGKSLMAIQLFSLIEKDLGYILPPSTLFKNPTIEKLAEVIRNDQLNDENQILIPLRSSGTRPPLFCIHGGGAHVFFYKKLADYLPEDQPIYSFQPPSLNGENDFPDSIETMASQYIEVMKTIQPAGPYYLLGTCFSNAVVLEMAHQLKAQGENMERLFIIDSAPVHLFGNENNGKNKTFSRFFDMLKRGDFNRIQHKIKGRFYKKKQAQVVVPETESNSEKQLRKTISLLNKLYANYHWKAFEGRIHLIRSEEFHARSDKNYHLTQWKKLAKDGVKLAVVQGHHLTLFEDPEVKGLAEKIDQFIKNR